MERLKDNKNNNENNNVRSQAYSILGLKEGADDDSIEKRYLLLLRKHKASTRAGLKPDRDMDEVTAAYDLLKGNTLSEEEQYEPSPFFKKLGINPRKLSNFFSYNKGYIVGGILAILLAISVIKTMTRPRPDFRLAFLGEMRVENTAGIEDRIEERIDTIEFAYIDTAAGSADSDPHMVIPQKEAALVAAGDIDVFIVDKAKYEGYAEKGLFISLDEYLTRQEYRAYTNSGLILSTEDDSEGHQFGIDVTGSAVFGEFNIVGEQLIAGISYKSKQPELALEVLKLLAERK